MHNVCILGSTGSVGKNTLAVIALNLQKYKVVSLVAHKNDNEMLKQVRDFKPSVVVMVDAQAAIRLRDCIKREGLKTEVLSGMEHAVNIAKDVNSAIVVAAIVGAAGLLPTFAAVKAGKKILLANKEALVMTGALFMSAVRSSGATLLPIDSEHNAIFQCLAVNLNHAQIVVNKEVKRLLLTASGGPFRNKSMHELEGVTPDEACAHPNWSMGRKISVDSATMMNKGLELIEACWLFDIKPQHIDIVIHPQSIIHSMVEYIDGSLLAHMGYPDMRIPIAYALGWPDRIDSGVNFLSLSDLKHFNFEPFCVQRYPCLQLALDVANADQSASVVLNAANEEAVNAFLNHQLEFTKIYEVIDFVLQSYLSVKIMSIGHVLAIDKEARRVAKGKIRKIMALCV